MPEISAFRAIQRGELRLHQSGRRGLRDEFVRRVHRIDLTARIEQATSGKAGIYSSFNGDAPWRVNAGLRAGKVSEVASNVLGIWTWKTWNHAYCSMRTWAINGHMTAASLTASCRMGRMWAAHPSVLFQTLNAKFSTATWEQQIEAAASLWESVTNINLALVSDGGQAVGTSGEQQDDPRFGDIRIGAGSAELVGPGRDISASRRPTAALTRATSCSIRTSTGRSTQITT